MVLVGCGKKPQNTDVTPITDVVVGVKDVHTALKEAVDLHSSSAYYLSFDYEVDKGADDYNVMVDFDAVIDHSDNDLDARQLAAGEGNTKLALRIHTAQPKELLSIYYFGGVLYVNYPNTVGNAAIREVPVAAIAQYLHTSAYSDDGQIRGVLDVLVEVANRLFATCRVTADEDTGETLYAFTVDKDSLAAGLAFLAAYSGPIDEARWYTLLGLDRNLTLLDDTTLTVVFRVRVEGAVKTLVGVELKKTTGDTTLVDKLRDFSCVGLVPTTVSQYAQRVTVADNLSRYNYYHPANLDLAGTLSVNVHSTNTAMTVMQKKVTANLVGTAYQYDVDLLSNYDSEGNYVMAANFVSKADRSHSLSLYYAENVLYFDLSAYGLGRWKMTTDALQQVADQCGAAYAYADLTPAQIRDIVLDLVDRVVEGDVTTYTLDGNHTATLLGAVQNLLCGGTLHTLLPMDINAMSVAVTDRNNRFANLTVGIEMAGMDMVLSCDNPWVGRAVTIEAPDWLDECRDPQADTTYTLTATGKLTAYTNVVNKTKLLQAYLESISGESVDLGIAEIDNYKAAVSLTAKGALQAFMLDFYTESGSFVCSVYHHVQSMDNVYVILPAVDGVTVVRTLRVKQSAPYADFIQAISPNAIVDSEIPACELRNGEGWVRLTFSAAGLGDLLRDTAKVLPDLSYTALPKGAFVQAVRLTVGKDAGLRIIFGGNRFIDFSFTSYGLGDFSLNLPSGLGNKSVSLYDENSMPDPVDVRTVYADGSQRNLCVGLDSMKTAWQYDYKPGPGNEPVSVHATCTLLGQRVSMLLYVNCTAPTYTLVGTGQLSGNQFKFDRYTDQAKLHNTIDAYTGVRLGSDTTLRELQWTHGGVPYAMADYSRPDREQDDDSYYKLVPTVVGFFGDPIPLTAEGEEYTVCLHGPKVASIQNASTLVTLSAYYGVYDPNTTTYNEVYNPFSTDTYVAALRTKYGRNTPVFLDENGGEVAVNNVYWDIDSIDNVAVSAGGIKVNNIALSKAELENALSTQLYALSGKYKINVVAVDSLGGRTVFDTVRVTVMPKLVQTIAFAELADGVDYATAAEAGVTGKVGVFGVQAATYGNLRANFAFAKTVNVTFADGTAKAFSAKDWTCTPQESISLFAGARGDVILSVGDEIGGKQQQLLAYEVDSLPVESLALWGYDADGIKTVVTDSVVPANDRTDSVTFDLTGDKALDPYRYVYPCGLVVQGKVEGAPHAEYIEHTWTFAGWDERILWHTDTVFEAQDSVYNVDVKVRLQFVRKYVRSWSFVDPVPDANTYTVATVPVYEAAENGAYVVQDGLYVPYDSTKHEGLARYSSTGAAYEVLYTKQGGVWRLVMDPNRVDYRLRAAYPAKVYVTFEDAPAEVVQLDAVWDLSAVQKLSMAETFVGTVGLSIAMQQPLANIYMNIESILEANTYVRVTKDENGAITAGSDVIPVSVLSVKEGALVCNDVAGERYLHSIICGCDDPTCRGKIYFDYEDSANADMEFAISEWRHLDRIRALFDGSISAELVGGSVTVVAVANNIECPVVINVIRSPLLGVEFDPDGIPTAVSSLYSGGKYAYSMQAVAPTREDCVLALDVDPYLADVRVAACYPLRLQFYLKGDQEDSTVAVMCTLPQTAWDLTAVADKTPYLGLEGRVRVAIATPMGDVRLGVQLKVKRRIIQTVLIDGENTNNLYIDTYSTTPFGSDLVLIGDRYYAQKTVGVQFEGEDLVRYLNMRYDITDICAPYYAKQLTMLPITIEVGNTAGGYQTLYNYYLHSTANQVLRVTCNLAAMSAESEAYKDLVAYFGPREEIVLYDNGTFVQFDDTAAGNKAWRALTVLCNTLQVECGIYVDRTYTLYQAGNAQHDGLQRYRLDAYDYEAAADGNYVFADGAFVSYDAGLTAHRTLQRYALRAATYEASLDGNYVLQGQTFVPYVAALHEGRTRYNVRGQDTNIYLQNDLGDYVFAGGAFVEYAPQYAGYMRFAVATHQQNTFGFVPDEGGLYVNIDGNFVLYDVGNASHGGKAHYSLVGDSPRVFVQVANGSYVNIDGAMTLYMAKDPAHQGLTRYDGLVYRYVADDDGAYVQTNAYYVTTAYNATTQRDGNGVMYAWSRADMGGGSHVVLQVWNRNAIFAQHLSTEQTINTRMARYILLADTMLDLSNLNGIVAEDKARITYDGGTVADFIAAYRATAVHAEAFAPTDLDYNIYAATDESFAHALRTDAVLHAGDYVLRITVRDDLYGGHIDVPLVVSPALLEQATATISGTTVSLAGLAGGYTVATLSGLRVASGVEGVDVLVSYYQGETPLNAMPYSAGDYRVVLAVSTDDYVLPVAAFNLAIRG